MSLPTKTLSTILALFAATPLATIVATMSLAIFVACGDPTSRTPAIAVTFDSYYPPPTTLSAGATAGIAADVANDPKNGGVNFTCAPAAECGTFLEDPIASGVPTTYQAPATAPAVGNVTITATSVTDPTKSVSAMITID